ncbi:MAG: cytochrome c peroxidase [Rhodospirillales bacterium]
MAHLLTRSYLIALLLVSAALPTAAVCGDTPTAEAVGEVLFFDTNLSKNRTQACATCHSPEVGFVDPRDTPAGRAVSLGDDGHSLGDRNTPTAAYARFSPKFHRNDKGVYVGGLFLDGRAATLEDQAGQPPLNPLEMGMADKAAVVARLKENPIYVEALTRLYGDGALASTEAGYAAMTASIAAFERTPMFAPFDSKFDRWQRGEETLTEQEELGRVLFFSTQFSNCGQCHLLEKSRLQPAETFTNHEFHNIGVPANRAARAVNGVTAVDRGLAQNPAVSEPDQAGKFKVPTLRNVAVTGPYMHNGVFKDLRTVVLFYNKYNTKNPERLINPETGRPFDPPEVDANISLKELEIGPALDDKRIDALVAFLKTLTDRRYESLLHAGP